MRQGRPAKTVLFLSLLLLGQLVEMNLSPLPMAVPLPLPNPLRCAGSRREAIAAFFSACCGFREGWTMSRGLPSQ